MTAHKPTGTAVGRTVRLLNDPPFPIERDVPLPDRAGRHRTGVNGDVERTLLMLQVEESFSAPIKQSTAQSIIADLRKQTGRQWCTRRESGNRVRMWRTK